MGITLRKDHNPQHGWGKPRIVAAALSLVLFLTASQALLGEPVGAEENHGASAQAILPTAPALLTTNSVSEAIRSAAPSVSSFSAGRSRDARVLLAAELTANGASARAVQAMFPLLPAPAPQLGALTSDVEDYAAEQSTAESTPAATAAAIGRSLRAYEPEGETSEDVMAARRRATFSSAITRAAAAGALALPDQNFYGGSSLRPDRFTPPSSSGEFDPGFSEAAEFVSMVPGLRLSSATLFGGYSSNAVPSQFLQGPSAFRGADLGADFDLGASAALDYSHSGRRSATRLSYVPSYVRRNKIPEWSSFDQRLSFTSSRDLTPRLTLSGRAGAFDLGREQFWVERPVLRTLTDVPSSFEELVSRLKSGQLSDDEFASLLTGAPVVDNPGGQRRDLGHVFSVSAGASGSYVYSPRTTLQFGASSNASRLVDGSLSAQSRQGRYINHARRSSLNASWAYRLSSRTRFAVSHRTSFSNSSYAESVSQSPSASLMQTLGRHWAYEVGGGLGVLKYSRVQENVGNQDLTTWTAHGSMSYVRGTHSFRLNAARQVGDPYGFGNRSTTSGGLLWSWQQRFSPWGASAGVTLSRSDYGGVYSSSANSFTSNLFTAGLSRRLTPSTTFRSDYFYGSYDSPYGGVASNMSLHRVQFSLAWAPVEPR